MSHWSGPSTLLASVFAAPSLPNKSISSSSTPCSTSSPSSSSSPSSTSSSPSSSSPPSSTTFLSSLASLLAASWIVHACAVASRAVVALATPLVVAILGLLGAAAALARDRITRLAVRLYKKLAWEVATTMLGPSGNGMLLLLLWPGWLVVGATCVVFTTYAL